MEEDKYFIPDIEDIRTGYECELYVEDSWQEATLIDITKLGLKFNSFNKKKEWIFTNVDGTVIKTPYLTKEQIEAEGWQVIDDKNPAKFKHPVEVDVQVIYDFENHYLWITIPAEIVKEKIKYRANKYAGYCKSINEFRYISKLLQLNI